LTGALLPSQENRPTVSNSSIVRELWAYMRARKKLWLLPILVVLGIVSLLLVVAQGSALAPFIYSIF
jgi:hypothetical protein